MRRPQLRLPSRRWPVITLFAAVAGTTITCAYDPRAVDAFLYLWVSAASSLLVLWLVAASEARTWRAIAAMMDLKFSQLASGRLARDAARIPGGTSPTPQPPRYTKEKGFE